MAMTPLLRRTHLKPPAGFVRVDWSHPLAKDLAVALPFNEGAGPAVVDSVTGIVGTLGSAVTWANGPNGPVLDFPSDGANGFVDFPASVRLELPSTGWSIAVGMMARSAGNLSYGVIVTLSPSDHATTADLALGFNGNSTI